MIRLVKVLLPRRSFKGIIKIIGVTLFLSMLIDFGFRQSFDFDNGEYLDRNSIEELQAIETTGLLTKRYILDDYESEDYEVDTYNDILNYEKMKDDWMHASKNGDRSLGENGVASELRKDLPDDMQKLYDEGWKNHQFNEYLSNQISLRRELPDVRNHYCKNIEASYNENLPATSIIVIFHNEAWSTLLRTVHSVLDRSPAHLITEVILVDDFSDMDHLKQPLDKYIASLPKVRLLRAKKRGGLIKARLLGAAAAKGPVLTFLDSHCECAPGWLEPLLDRIAQNPSTVPWPLLESIENETFEYFAQKGIYHVQVGGFDWSLMFKWIPESASEKRRKKNPAEPTKSPTMAGGIFSIDKAFFERLGTYDPGFDIWGAENLELSFKIWMCGGIVEVVPCSHVGHISRKVSPYVWRPGVDVLKRNSVRLAEVWMDDYKKFYYFHSGSFEGDYGDISDRVKLRQDLKCESFQWYVDNVYPELKLPDIISS